MAVLPPLFKVKVPAKNHSARIPFRNTLTTHRIQTCKVEVIFLTFNFRKEILVNET